MRAILLIGAAFFAGVLAAQSRNTFEVASIKVHSPASDGPVGPGIAGNRFTRSGNVNQLLMYAYDLKVYQLSGGPSWVTQPSTNGDYYDIEAVAGDDEALTQNRARQLLQSLLEQRFRLKFHRETREMPVYALVAGKGGPKFKDSAPNAVAPPRASTVTQTTVAATFVKSRMDDLIRVLNGAADRPVLDQTGLAGIYDFQLTFARDPAAAMDQSSTVSLFTALQEQLGLKLEPRRGPVDVFVVDSIGRPTEN